jgi:hypothetical protein
VALWPSWAALGWSWWPHLGCSTSDAWRSTLDAWGAWAWWPHLVLDGAGLGVRSVALRPSWAALLDLGRPLDLAPRLVAAPGLLDLQGAPGLLLELVAALLDLGQPLDLGRDAWAW